MNDAPETPGGSPAPVAPGATWSGRDWIFALLLIAALLLAYHPAWHGTPIWDDDAHLTRPELCSWTGLYRIWFELGATQQYYPVAHSAFWVQHWLWGDWYAGYHLVNILLHATGALLLVRILRRLEVPGAWLAAALWALHPVQVESVAWMSELKNTLSGVFYFSAALFYLRFDRERSAKAWFAALGLFIPGLLTKSVIATLPGTLLVVLWWKNGKLSWRKDVRPVIPFFAIGAASGLFTSWVERTLIATYGENSPLSLPERCLIAGRAFWFYLRKLVWPADLIFIYPRWHASAAVWWQFLFPATALALVTVLVWKRKSWGRAPLAAVLYFAGTLFPALGFLDIYPFRYSFVADHFQYLAGIGPLALVAAGAARVFARPGRTPLLYPACCAALLGALGVLTWKQSGMYAGKETLYRTTIARNPECWMACNNLGVALLQQGRTQEAIAQYREALRINPDYVDARNNLGNVLLQQGRIQEAINQYQEALRINPNDADTHYNLGNALLRQGNAGEAIAQYGEALRINPDYAEAHYNLGNVLDGQGHPQEAVAEYREVLRIDPGRANAHSNLGSALLEQGEPEEAMAEYREALRLDPARAADYYNLGAVLLQQGKTGEAVLHLQQALELQPANAIFQNQLAWVLATAPEKLLRNSAKALELALKAAQSNGDNPVILRTLAAAYAGTGDFSNAVRIATKALQLAEAQSNTELASMLRREIGLYAAARPFEEAR